MYNAYMIRNDGKEIPVKIHPYGNSSSIEETLYASQWLYRNTASIEVKKLCLDLVKSFAVIELGIEGDFKDSLLDWISTLKYIVLTEEYINEIGDLLDNANVNDLNIINNIICSELNQEFLRVRLGGQVNSERGSKEIVFRISSVAFNWFNIIYMFVSNHKQDILFITIVKDEESTGYTDYFYKYKGNVFNKMPIDEFLTLSGNPVVEELNSYPQRELLKKGKTIVESFGNINYEKLLDTLKLMHYHEVKDRGIWQKQEH